MRKSTLLLSLLSYAYSSTTFKPYMVPLDCLDSYTPGVTTTPLTGSALNSMTNGVSLVINKGYYCYHQFLYEFQINWTQQSGDTASDYTVEYVNMLNEKNFGVCAPPLEHYQVI